MSERVKTPKNNVCAFLRLILILLVLAAVPGLRTPADEKGSADTTIINGTIYSFDKYSSWDYAYSDAFFSLPSDTYHHPLAQVSLGLALSTFRDTSRPEAQDDCLTAFLEDAGFEDIDTHTFGSDPSPYSIALGIARKKLGDDTLIALAVCGGNYGIEWASNLTIGDDTLAQGFADAARKVTDELDAYLERYPSQGDMKIWITGFSRGGAVANIAAAGCTDSGRFKDTYAYTFASPRTTRDPGDYRNIFNIIRKSDPVPKIPLEDWGYQRYGVDRLLVSPETDTDCEEIIRRSAGLYKEVYGSEMVMNTKANSQVRVILDHLLYLLPDSASYSRLLQPVLVDLMTGSGTADLSLETLIEALNRFAAENKRQENVLAGFLDYLETLFQIYVLQGTTKDLPPSLWDQKLGSYNLFSEHIHFKYLANMYASDDPDRLFSDNTVHLRLVIYGDIDAEIYDGDTLLRTVRADEVEDSANSADASFSYPIVECSDRKRVISLAGDRTYTIRAASRTRLPQTLIYSANLYTGDTFRAKMDPVYFRILKPGDSARIVTSKDGLTSGSGRVIDPEKSDFNWSSSLIERLYTPTVALRMEEIEIPHLTISGVVTFLAYMLSFLLIQLVASIALALRRKKKGCERNSVFTTVWHGINLLLFAFCEFSMWYFVPTIPLLRIVPMILVLLVLLACSWKLYTKCKSPEKSRRFCIFAASLAVFGLLNGCFAGRFTPVKTAFLILIYLAFLAAPLFLFRGSSRASDIPSDIPGPSLPGNTD